MIEYDLMMILLIAMCVVAVSFLGTQVKALDSSLMVPVIVVLAAVLVAAWTDLWKFKIENALTIPLIVTGLVYQTWAAGFSGLAGSILGILLGGLPLLALYARGGMGAGDVKLMAGVGAWLGPWIVLHVLFFSGFAIGCYAAGRELWRRVRPREVSMAPVGSAPPPAVPQPISDHGTDGSWLDHLQAGRNTVPFAVMVVPGVVGALLWVARMS